MTVGSQLCPHCGTGAVEAHRQRLWQRVRYWLVNGSDASTEMTCAQGHQWTGGGRTLIRRGRTGRFRRLLLPVELFRVVRRARSMVPVPLTYLMAILVGGGLGVILNIAVGWPWWLVAVGLFAAVWLFFFASALWGPGRTLGNDLLRVIDPQRARARRINRLEDAVTTGRLVCFEVADWDGSRSIGGWGGSRQPERVTLHHGEPQLDDFWVSIATRSTKHVGGANRNRDRLIRQLLRTAEGQPPDDLDVVEQHQWRIQQHRRLEETEQPPWSRSVLNVDGHETRCEVARVADRWAAMAVVDNVVIEITAHGIEPSGVGLRRLATLKTYIDGQRELQHKRRLEHGH